MTPMLPLWLIRRGPEPLALVAAPSFTDAVLLVVGDRSTDGLHGSPAVGTSRVQRPRVVADLRLTHNRRRQRPRGDVPVIVPPEGRAAFLAACAALQVDPAIAERRHGPKCTRARWGAWLALAERGYYNTQIGAVTGHHHSSVSAALITARCRVEAGDAMLLAARDAAVRVLAGGSRRADAASVTC